jgi:hypothetical protein
MIAAASAVALQRCSCIERRGSESEERLEWLEAQDHPAGLLVLLREHTDMLGRGMDIAQRPLRRAYER